MYVSPFKQPNRSYSGDNHNHILPWSTCCQVLSSQPVSEPGIHYDYEAMVVMVRIVVMVTMVMMVMMVLVMMVLVMMLMLMMVMIAMMIGAKGSQ